MTDTPRHTGRGIVIHDGCVLLIERFRDNLHYFSIPGGGIESGETPEQTAVREIYEETSIRVSVKAKLYEMHTSDGVVHHIYRCAYINGEPELQPDSEEARNTALGINQFKPKWVSMADLADSPFMYWTAVAEELQRDLKQGFDKRVKVLAADPGS